MKESQPKRIHSKEDEVENEKQKDGLYITNHPWRNHEGDEHTLDPISTDDVQEDPLS